jgi:hypothetical protein
MFFIQVLKKDAKCDIIIVYYPKNVISTAVEERRGRYVGKIRYQTGNRKAAP